jgi:archaemetzincin
LWQVFFTDGTDPTYLAIVHLQGDPCEEHGWDDHPTKTIILGICDFDAYSSGLNFVFGQASLSGGVAVIYLPRLRQEFYGLGADTSIFIERVLKEATHELGHALGLNHCPKRSCVMYFSNSLIDTDRKGKDFCNMCSNKLRQK